MSEAKCFYIQTFGCRCNQADSAALRDELCRESFSETASAHTADLLVVNTCTVTHRSDQQVRQTVRKLHRENPGARIAVTGCYAERDPGALASIAGVNVVVGNADKRRFARWLNGGWADAAARVVNHRFEPGTASMVPSMTHTGGKTRPMIKLQDGCDARCSYCIVPLVRGPGRSAHPEEVVREVESLVDRGYQEIVLTGVHLGTYGRKLEQPTSLVELLTRVLKIPGLGRIRLSSTEPMRFSRELVRLAATSRVLAPHFHLPIQSGSNRVLRRMRRPYTAERYLSLLHYIVEQVPDAGLGTDLLVGFPGETEDDFRRTVDLVEQSPLSYLHVFPFSPREGTDAWSMKDRVPPRVVRERTGVLRSLSQQRNLAFRRRFVGSVLEAITLAKEEQLGESVALTGNYIDCRITRSAAPPNRLVRVRILDVVGQRTTAELIDSPSRPSLA